MEKKIPSTTLIIDEKIAAAAEPGEFIASSALTLLLRKSMNPVENDSFLMLNALNIALSAPLLSTFSEMLSTIVCALSESVESVSASEGMIRISKRDSIPTAISSVSTIEQGRFIAHTIFLGFSFFGVRKIVRSIADMGTLRINAKSPPSITG